MSTYFGKLLKILRKETGMSREEVSEKTGVSTGSVSAYEQGVRLPKTDVIVKLALCFDDVDIDMLLNAYMADMAEEAVSELIAAGVTADSPEFQKFEQAYWNYSRKCTQDNVRRKLVKELETDNPDEGGS